MSPAGSTLFFALCLNLAKWTYCLECFSCLLVTDQLSCNQTTRCGQNEVCFTYRRDALLTLGCTYNQQCSLGSQGTLIGREVTTRQLSNCQECCSTDLCNSNLCLHFQPSACLDDETVDCAKMNTLFGICADVHKAKLVCAKFCNLCTMVDGQWSEWSSWSVCSVTCENGQQGRQRSCTNPAPANGGLDCNGTSLDTKSCSLEACPVHGGWTTWSDWGICSVSCDVGMQRRERNCSNPYPDKNGFHCFGDPSEYRICMPRACGNGSWSEWGSWTSCSDSCGGGVKTRERSCTNPPPSMIGKSCIGNLVQSTTCNRNPCLENCKVILDKGDAISGFKTIFPDEFHSFLALCIMDVDGGGWTVIQQRESASDFYKNWTEYKHGFGNTTNFWIGLDNIHRLTAQGNYELRVDMKKSNGQRSAAKYGNFVVGNETTLYNLTVANYSYAPVFVDPGDSLIRVHNGMKFTTYDMDNDMNLGENCATYYKGGYWYNGCYSSNLNGVYGSTDGTGIKWSDYYDNETIIFTRMMIRPNNNDNNNYLHT